MYVIHSFFSGGPISFSYEDVEKTGLFLSTDIAKWLAAMKMNTYRPLRDDVKCEVSEYIVVMEGSFILI